MTTHDLIARLLSLSKVAVREALDDDIGNPEDRYIWRELQELQPAAEAWMAAEAWIESQR